MLMEFCLLFATQAFFEREGISDIYIKTNIEQKINSCFWFPSEVVSDKKSPNWQYIPLIHCQLGYSKLPTT